MSANLGGIFLTHTVDMRWYHSQAGRRRNLRAALLQQYDVTWRHRSHDHSTRHRRLPIVLNRNQTRISLA